VARVVLVLGHLPVICEGCCAFPGGAPKATLVNCSCHLATSLVVLLGSLALDCQPPNHEV
jgi:hypothetical protein